MSTKPSASSSNSANAASTASGRGKRCAYAIGVYLIALTLSGVAVWRSTQRFLDPAQLARVSYHGDESLHLEQSDAFDLYWLDPDWHSPRWFRDRVGPDQPHVGHILIGWQLWRCGLPRPACRGYRFSRSFAENVAAGAVPGFDALITARQLMGRLAVVTIAILALTGFAVGRPLTGAIAANLLATNNLFVVSMSRTMLEAPMLLTISAAILLAILTWRMLHHRRSWAVVVGLVCCGPTGIAIGLATGTKLLAGITAIYWLLITALLWIEPRFRRRPKAIVPFAAMAVVAMTSAGAFYWTNPFLCSYPAGQPQAKLGLFGGLRDMFDHAEVREAVQQYEYPEYAVFEWWRRFGLAVHRTLIGHEPMPIAPPAATPEALAALPFRDADADFQVRSSFASIGPVAGVPVDLLLALIGVGVLGWQIVRCYRRCRRIESGALLLAWFLVALAVTAYWLPLDWDRYYLVLLAAAQLMVGAAVAAPLEWWLHTAPLVREPVARADAIR